MPRFRVSLSILARSSASFALPLSGFCLCLSFSPGLCSWTYLFLSCPGVPLGSCHSLNLLLSLCFSVFLFLLRGGPDQGEKTGLDGPSLKAGLQWSSRGPHGGQAGGWEGKRIPVTKSVPYFLPGAAGLGSMWAAHPALDAGVSGRKARRAWLSVGLESTFPRGVHVWLVFLPDVPSP